MMEQIKKMKENGNIGWGKRLIPFCKSYFDKDSPITFIKTELLTLYQLDVSIDTIKTIRKKYKKSSNGESTPKAKSIEQSIRTANTPLNEQEIIERKLILQRIEKMKENRKIGWGKLLIPFCKGYFDEDYPVPFIKTELLTLYQLDIAIDTLKYIKTKYIKNLSGESNQKTKLIEQSITTSNTPLSNVFSKEKNLFPTIPNEQQEIIERELLIEQIKKMKENGHNGWGKLLIPFCKNYFDNNLLTYRFIKTELLALYQLDISIDMLFILKKKYIKSLVNT